MLYQHSPDWVGCDRPAHAIRYRQRPARHAHLGYGLFNDDRWRTVHIRRSAHTDGESDSGTIGGSACRCCSGECRGTGGGADVRDLPLKTFLDEPLIDPETDEVSRLILDQHDAAAFAPIASLTVGEFREWLLAPSTGVTLERLRFGLTPEMAAAASKLMRVQDLIAVAAKCQVITRFRSTLGLPGTLAARNQPNHPTDDSRGIAASTLDGLLMGSGDAVIGVNPANDSVEDYVRIVTLLDEIRTRLDIPTQTCCLGHVTTAIEAMNRGAPVDLVFQSIAGSEKANAGFGVALDILREAQDAAHSLKRGEIGTDLMYFETGQGAALSADAHHGVDQQTMEARAYAVARAFDCLLINRSSASSGPNTCMTASRSCAPGSRPLLRQASRTADGRGRLLHEPCRSRPRRHGCPADRARRRRGDVRHHRPGRGRHVLNYQSLAHHDVVYARETLDRRPAPEFEAWMIRTGLADEWTAEGHATGQPFSVRAGNAATA